MTHTDKRLPGRALRATDGIEHSALGRVLVSFANPAKVDAQRTKATPRAAGAAARPVAGAARLPAVQWSGVTLSPEGTSCCEEVHMCALSAMSRL